METLERILEEHPFFSGLHSDYVKLLVSCASNVRFNSGEMIFRQGQTASHFYLLRHGMVAIELPGPHSGPVTIQTLGAGEVLGWSWLVPPYCWRFEARALQLTRAISLNAECLRTKCEEDHDLGYELMKRFTPIMVQRLEASRLQLLDIYGPTGAGE